MSQSIRVSSRAILLHNNQILLNCFGDGLYYNFPGGGIEPGETAIEAVVREVFEESGLRVEAQRLLFTYDYEPTCCIYSHGNQHHISLFFACKLMGSAEITAPTIPDINPEGVQSHAQWIPICELSNTPFVPNTILNSLLKYINTGLFEPNYFAHFNPDMEERP